MDAIEPIPLPTSLGERRRAITAGRVFLASHDSRCDGNCSQKDSRWWPEYGYELFGQEFAVRFPECCCTAYWVGSRHAEWVSQTFGVSIALSKDMEYLLERHSRHSSFDRYRLPSVLERGPHRYYCLRDVIRAGLAQHTFCAVCGHRAKGVDGDDHFQLRRAVRQISQWRYEFEYFCSWKCRNRYYKLQEHDKKRQEVERLWIRKGKQQLKACRTLLRERTKNNRPVW